MVEILFRVFTNSFICGEGHFRHTGKQCKIWKSVFDLWNFVTNKMSSLDPDNVEDLVTIKCNMTLLEEFENDNGN